MRSERMRLLEMVGELPDKWQKRYEELRANTNVIEAARQTIREEREAMLAPYFKAIREGRAFLNTAWGRKKVTGYNHDSGWVVTNNTGNYLDQQSFMVCLNDIEIVA